MFEGIKKTFNHWQKHREVEAAFKNYDVPELPSKVVVETPEAVLQDATDRVKYDHHQALCDIIDGVLESDDPYGLKLKTIMYAVIDNPLLADGLVGVRVQQALQDQG